MDILSSNNQPQDWGGNHISNELAQALHTNNHTTHDPLDQNIAEAKHELNELQTILTQFQDTRQKYKNIIDKKEKKLQQLRDQYKKYTKDQPQEDTDRDDEEYNDFADQFEDFFSSMGFGDARWFNGFSDQHREQQQEEKYVKTNIQEITGELVDKLQDLSIKQIRRAISLVLHEDKLQHNKEVNNHQDYYTYCLDLFKKLGNFYAKDDKWAMIQALQEAQISYNNKRFILPSYSIFQQNVGKRYKQQLLQELQERITYIKQLPIYAFYKAYITGQADRKIGELEEQIRKFEDLIASYQTIHHD